MSGETRRGPPGAGDGPAGGDAIIERPPTLGVILAGGLARRLGGGDKGLRAIGGRTLIARVAARLAPQCEGLVLNANGDPARFSALGLPVVADGLEGRAGPLAGVLAALDFAAAQDPAPGWVVSVPGDCPFVPRDLVAGLHRARLAAGATLAVAASGGRTHHAIGLWPVAAREALRRALIDEGLRRVGQWSARHAPATAAWPREPRDPFFNVNTPEDLAEAGRLAGPDD